MPNYDVLYKGMSFGEGPRWHDGRLYVSDFHTHRVLAIAMDGKAEIVAQLSDQPSGIGFLPDGRMLVVSMHDRKVMRREHNGSLTVHADLSGVSKWTINDMLVDQDGRAWVGTMGFDEHSDNPIVPTPIICVEPNGAAKIASGDLYIPNGMVQTKDGRTLIVGETMGNRLTAFDKSSGALTNQRVWASFGEVPSSFDATKLAAQTNVSPDGICIDAEGAIWLADAMHNRLLRVAEGGRILDKREMDPGMGAWACALGGADGSACAANVIHGYRLPERPRHVLCDEAPERIARSARGERHYQGYRARREGLRLCRRHTCSDEKYSEGSHSFVHGRDSLKSEFETFVMLPRPGTRARNRDTPPHPAPGRSLAGVLLRCATCFAHRYAIQKAA